MPKLSAHFAMLDNSEKLKFGPIIFPRPGPTFEIEVAEADIEVRRSRPVNANMSVIIKKVKIKINKKVITDSIISKERFSPLYL